MWSLKVEKSHFNFPHGPLNAIVHNAFTLTTDTSLSRLSETLGNPFQHTPLHFIRSSGWRGVETSVMQRTRAGANTAPRVDSARRKVSEQLAPLVTVRQQMLQTQEVRLARQIPEVLCMPPVSAPPAVSLGPWAFCGRHAQALHS